MQDKIIRKQLEELLNGRGAHISFEDAVSDFPLGRAGARVAGLEHTMWMLVHHMRIAQRDILEFIRNPDHRSPEYPKGYWPEQDAPENEQEWQQELVSFRTDLAAMKELVRNPGTDLFTPIPHGSGQNIFREALVLADHNSYHVGQIVDLRMLLGVPVRDW